MSDSKKFTTEELDKIKKLRDDNARLIQDMGQVEIEFLVLNNRIDLLSETKEKLTGDFKSLQQQEKDLVKELNEKYGTGTVDIASGEFIPANWLFG